MKHRDAALERVAIWNALIGMAMIPLGIGTAAFTADALTAVQAGDWSACLRAVLLMAVCTLATLALAALKKAYVERRFRDAEQGYRQALYRRFIDNPAPNSALSASRYQTIFRRDAREVAAYYANVLPEVITAAVGYLAYTVYVCAALNGGLFALVMTLLSAASLLPPVILEKFLMKNFIAGDQAESDLAGELVAGCENYAVMKLYNLHDWFMKRYGEKQKVFWRVGMRSSASGSLASAMDDIVRFLQTLGLVAFLGWAVLRGMTTFACAIQIYMLSAAIYRYTAALFGIRSSSAACRAALGQIEKHIPLREKQPEIDRPAQIEAASVTLDNLSYATPEKPLYTDVSLTILPGEKCLIRGENGAGKSTLIHLIIGELAPSSGSVSIAETPVRGDMRPLRRWFAYCPQSAPAMNCTAKALYERVCAAQCGVSADKLAACSKALGLSENDLEKPLSEMSGGMQKKVILSLALAKDAPLLLLDEPEAMLDQAATDALIHMLGGRRQTVLIVSHESLYDNWADAVLRVGDNTIVKEERHG